MIIRSALTALTCLGIVACAGAQTPTEEAPTPTVEDVKANPDAWRAVDPNNLIILTTTKGEVVIELLPAVAEVHAEQFRAYTRNGHYDNTPFHRVIRDFMAQGGDVEQTHGRESMLEPMAGEFTFRRSPADMAIDPIGPADSAVGGYYMGFPIETQAQFLADLSIDGLVESWIPHCKGVVSTARTNDPNSGNAQFFLMTGRAEHLDKGYTAKGRVLLGQEAVDNIKLGRGENGSPVDNPDILQKAVLVSTLPESEQPKVWVQRTDTPEWTERLEAADRTGTHICDLPAVPAVLGK
ncbi:peptidylprolyl isomerase [Hyphomonas sp. FCG-A18]|uniref:peptidylprolyl isomerase n=1 Tax=Hyphomonas sp. FCG-A18 TaxID=3080019 RepID=UPI002B2867E1|nr:peptidylprolyl isomerase [Hyphomonas sp. FCG-A18]